MEPIQSKISKLIDFLGNPENLPDETGEVTICQTHGSVLALADHHVYKVKKPVDFGFMDFTTLEKRQANARREIKLNRRLCSDTYLDAVTITEADDGSWRFGDGKGEIIDCAVRMKRLEDGFFLPQILKKGDDPNNMMEIISDRLMEFYGGQTGECKAEYGDISKIRQDCEGNFQAMEKLPEAVVHPVLLETVKSFTYTFLDRYATLFEERVREGKIQECHGDLHMDHIHYKDGRLCIFDCIEFNEAFRCIDIANDLAFLAMDLEHQGYIREAAHFTTLMAKGLKDEHLTTLMHFYKAYRACVRGKVHGLAGTDPSLPPEERRLNLDEAASFFQLAMQYACCGLPAALIFFGPAGSGKSTLAGRIGGLAGCPVLNSDVLRKELFSLPVDEPAPDSVKADLYSRETTDRVYNILIEKGLKYAKTHRTIILDATYANPDHRGETRLAFRSAAIDPLFIFVTAEEKMIHGRLSDRNKATRSVSDAREKDFDTLVAGYRDPDPGNYQGNLIEIDNSGDPEDAAQALLKTLTGKLFEKQKLKRGP